MQRSGLEGFTHLSCLAEASPHGAQPFESLDYSHLTHSPVSVTREDADALDNRKPLHREPMHLKFKSSSICNNHVKAMNEAATHCLFFAPILE